MSVLPLIMASQSIHVIHLSFSKGKNNYEISPTFCALLLIIIFLLVFMLVCHICMCNHRDEIGDLLPTNQNRTLSWMRSARGLDAATIGGLPTFFYKTSVMSISSSSSSSSNCNKSNQEAECCICLGSFEEGDKLKVLPGCHHGFHSECVDRWLRVRSSCPLCRASVLLQDSNGNSSMAAQG